MASLCKARNKHDGDNSKTSGYQWTRKFALECASRSCILFCYRQILDSKDEWLRQILYRTHKEANQPLRLQYVFLNRNRNHFLKKRAIKTKTRLQWSSDDHNLASWWFVGQQTTKKNRVRSLAVEE
jgi:hypothetical protein